MKTKGGDPKRRTSPRGKKPAVEREHKPLKGKKLFLDLKGYRGIAKLEQNLQTLGALIENSFSKDIHILVTNKGNPADYERGRKEGASTSQASPGFSTPSPFNPGWTHGVDSPQGDSPGQVEGSKLVSRGQSIAHKAKLTQNYGSTNIQEWAKQWKIKTVHVEKVQTWVQKEMEKVPASKRMDSKQGKKNTGQKQTKVQRLKGNFIKLEATSHHYQPIYQAIDPPQAVMYDTPPHTCPFERRQEGHQDVDELKEERAEVEGVTPAASKGLPDDTAKKKDKNEPKSTEDYLGTRKLMTAGEMRQFLREKITKELKKGYCEMCQVKYDDIDKHVRCDSHKRFVRNEKNFIPLDAMIKAGPNLEQFLEDVVRYHKLHMEEGRRMMEKEETTTKAKARRASAPEKRVTFQQPEEVQICGQSQQDVTAKPVTPEPVKKGGGQGILQTRKPAVTAPAVVSHDKSREGSSLSSSYAKNADRTEKAKPTADVNQQKSDKEADTGKNSWEQLNKHKGLISKSEDFSKTVQEPGGKANVCETGEAGAIASEEEAPKRQLRSSRHKPACSLAENSKPDTEKVKDTARTVQKTEADGVSDIIVISDEQQDEQKPSGAASGEAKQQLGLGKCVEGDTNKSNVTSSNKEPTGAVTDRTKAGDVRVQDAETGSSGARVEPGDCQNQGESETPDETASEPRTRRSRRTVRSPVAIWRRQKGYSSPVVPQTGDNQVEGVLSQDSHPKRHSLGAAQELHQATQNGAPSLPCGAQKNVASEPPSCKVKHVTFTPSKQTGAAKAGALKATRLECTPRQPTPSQESEKIETTPKDILSTQTLLKNKSQSEGKAPPSKRRVKLQHNWSMLSDRSMQKLLLGSNSEGEEFDITGRFRTSISQDPPTDYSFECKSEVSIAENSDFEWVGLEHQCKDDTCASPPKSVSVSNKRTSSEKRRVKTVLDFTETEECKENIKIQNRKRRKQVEEIKEGKVCEEITCPPVKKVTPLKAPKVMTSTPVQSSKGMQVESNNVSPVSQGQLPPAEGHQELTPTRRSARIASQSPLRQEEVEVGASAPSSPALAEPILDRSPKPSPKKPSKKKKAKKSPAQLFPYYPRAASLSARQKINELASSPAKVKVTMEKPPKEPAGGKSNIKPAKPTKPKADPLSPSTCSSTKPPGQQGSVTSPGSRCIFSLDEVLPRKSKDRGDSSVVSSSSRSSNKFMKCTQQSSRYTYKFSYMPGGVAPHRKTRNPSLPANKKVLTPTQGNVAKRSQRNKPTARKRLEAGHVCDKTSQSQTNTPQATPRKKRRLLSLESEVRRSPRGKRRLAAEKSYLDKSYEFVASSELDDIT